MESGKCHYKVKAQALKFKYHQKNKTVHLMCKLSKIKQSITPCAIFNSK